MDRSLFDSWKGFTKLTPSKEKLPKGCLWSRRQLTEIQATTRLDYLWPEIWSDMSKAAWAIEKPKLDNARKLRGIYFIDPKDGEFKETIKNARKKLEIPMEAAMPCKKETKKHSKACMHRGVS